MKIFEQFYNFHDALLLSFKFEYQSAEFVMLARDENDWKKVVLHIKDIKEFKIHEKSNVAWNVLSMGIAMMESENLYHFSFDPYTLVPNGVEDYKKSNFYIAATDFEFKVYNLQEEV